jgi:hypothetical protein
LKRGGLRRAAYDIAVIADIAVIVRDRKGKGKNLPRINTDLTGLEGSPKLKTKTFETRRTGGSRGWEEIG